MRKVVINICYGGFGLSHKAVMEIAKRKNMALYPYIQGEYKKGDKTFIPYNETKHKKELIYYFTKQLVDNKFDSNSFYYIDEKIERTDPDLVAVVEKLGKEANGECSKLIVEEVEDGSGWRIKEHDGYERISCCGDDW